MNQCTISVFVDGPRLSPASGVSSTSRPDTATVPGLDTTPDLGSHGNPGVSAGSACVDRATVERFEAAVDFTAVNSGNQTVTISARAGGYDYDLGNNIVTGTHSVTAQQVLEPPGGSSGGGGAATWLAMLAALRLLQRKSRRVRATPAARDNAL